MADGGGKHKYSYPVDIYALGVIFLTMLTGVTEIWYTLFNNNEFNANTTIIGHLKKYNKFWRKLIIEMMSKYPDNRPKAVDIVLRLQQYQLIELNIPNTPIEETEENILRQENTELLEKLSVIQISPQANINLNLKIKYFEDKYNNSNQLTNNLTNENNDLINANNMLKNNLESKQLEFKTENLNMLSSTKVMENQISDFKNEITDLKEKINSLNKKGSPTVIKEKDIIRYTNENLDLLSGMGFLDNKLNETLIEKHQGKMEDVILELLK